MIQLQWWNYASVPPPYNIFNPDLMQGHGFRTDLVEMLTALKPRFIRFPGMHKVVQIDKFQTRICYNTLVHYFCSVLCALVLHLQNVYTWTRACLSERVEKREESEKQNLFLAIIIHKYLVESVQNKEKGIINLF